MSGRAETRRCTCGTAVWTGGHDRCRSCRLAAELAELMPPAGDTAWQEQALCAQADPELFFPEKGESARDAKEVCARCPVQAACLEFALDHGFDEFGIFGGHSPRQRRRMRRDAKPGTGGEVAA